MKKTKAELISETNTLYTDHLESLIAYGQPFDEAGIRNEWAAEIARIEGLDNKA